MSDFYQIFSVISIFISLCAIILTAVTKDMKGRNWLLLSMFAYSFTVVTMYFEVAATTIDGALVAQMLHYLTSSFAALFGLIYFCEYSGFKPSIWIYIELICVKIAILFAIISNGGLHLFLTPTGFVDDGTFAHVEYEKGPFYYIYAAQIVFDFVLALFFMLRATRRNALKNDIETVSVAFGASVPCAVKILYVCGAFGYYDPTPFCVIVTSICLVVCVLVRRASSSALKGKELYIDSMQEGFLLLDKDKCFVSANAKTVSLFPYVSYMEEGARIDECEDDILKRAVNGEISEASINNRFYEFRITPIEEKRGIVGWIIISIDVTEAHNSFIRMTELKEKAESAAKAKETFLANMSHEIRTPMNAIVGMSSLLLESPDISDNILEYAKTIETSSQTLLGIINDVLDFSKVESGKMEILNDEYSLSATLHDVYSIMQIKMQEKGLEYRLHIDDNVPDKMFGDVIRLRQIMLNLLNNAVKFTAKGYVSVSVAWNEVMNGNGRLIIAVEDTGIGIKEEDFPKLFVDFTRLDGINNANTEGSGLGLSICQRLLKMMDGSIKVQSVYGTGSTFSFVIPQNSIGEDKCLEIMNERRKKSLTKSSAQTIDASGAVIMVVDDNETNIKVSGGLLTAMKATAILKGSGKAAIEYIKRGVMLPDIILMDHMMPEMDGIETTVEIRKLGEYGKRVKIIALTANAVSGIKNMFIENGFDGYVSKPIDLHSLGSYILKFLPDRKTPLERAVSTVKELSYADAMKMCETEEKYLAALNIFCDTVERVTLHLKTAAENMQKDYYKSEINCLIRLAEEIGNNRMLNMAKALEAASDEDADFIMVNTPVFTNFLNIQREIITKAIIGL